MRQAAGDLPHSFGDRLNRHDRAAARPSPAHTVKRVDARADQQRMDANAMPGEYYKENQYTYKESVHL
jgi:hypothetical protein